MSIVMKFGGSSVANAKCIQQVCQIIKNRRRQKPLVVTSAVGGITDLLIDTAHLAVQGKNQLIQANLQTIADKHFQIITQIITPKLRPILEKNLNTDLSELKNLYHGILCLQELSPRTLDLISSFGERMSSYLLTAALQSIGLPAERFDSRDFMLTNNNFGEATVDFSLSKRKFNRLMLPRFQKNTIPVITGFIGQTKKGITTTFGRGGSDFTASLIGLFTQAREIQIWTDVNGIMTADPRLIPQAHSIPTISFAEAAELAAFGAKVLHPKTIEPAVEKNIPIRILNTFNPTHPGSRLIRQTNTQRGQVKAISFKKNITVLNIVSTQMLNQAGFLARLFKVFQDFQVSIDIVATSEISVSVTIEDRYFQPALIQTLKQFASITVKKHQVIGCVVGHGLKHNPQIETQVFERLYQHKINPEIISKGASMINLSFVIPQEKLKPAAKTLHQLFFNS